MSKSSFRRAMLPALIVGLCVCGVSGTAPSVAFAQSTVEAPVRNLTDNQTILRATVGYGRSGVVYINNRRIPEGPSGDYMEWVDVSRYVRPGQNTVRIEVEGSKPLIYTIEISHAESRGRFRRIGDFSYTPFANRKESGHAYRFTLPGDSATDVNSERKPRAGSQSNQTLLVTESISPITAWVNGKRVGDFQAGNKLDISNFVRSGENTLRVTWQNSTFPFSVRIAHAESKNAFRDVSRLSVGLLDERRQLQKEIQFVLP